VKRIGGRVVYQGKIATVRIDEFAYPDGGTAEREIVSHPGAVAIVVHDDTHLYLVRQPREPVNEEALLELPAGKLDVAGEGPLETAKRELVEEIGKRAEEWRELRSFYTSPGFAEERVWIYLAAGLSDASGDAEEEERIEVVRWPLDDLDAAISECEDAKSLIGLMLFRELQRAD
jgi:8-oxo-dGTP pyrophosphatase MutT (NUDIX family)